MSDNNKTVGVFSSTLSLLVFIGFCNLYQGDVAIVALRLGTIYLSLIWTTLIFVGIALILLIIGAAAS